jgi:hypothetical protein
MTDTTTTEALPEFEVGQIVKSATGDDVESATQYGSKLRAGGLYRVVRVNKKTLQLARISEEAGVDGGYPYYNAVNGVAKEAVIPSTEKIKTFLERFIPEGMEDEVISPDDPRLDYIWRAAAKAADDSGYCSVYDDITKRVGIPGRPKNYTVNIKVGSLVTRVTIQARSKAEAQQIAEAALNSDTGKAVELVTAD